MANTLRDISGRPIPNARTNGNAPAARVVAVPSIANAPSDQAQEFLSSWSTNLGAAGAGFVQLTDLSTVLPMAFTGSIGEQYSARIDTVTVFCPDMIAASAPYLWFRLTINDVPAGAWGTVPVYPRAGVASVSFDVALYLKATARIKVFGFNTDAANAHFLAVYVHGWQYPQNNQDG